MSTRLRLRGAGHGALNMKISIIILISMLTPLRCFAADAGSHDGTWWGNMSHESKLGYILGYWDGELSAHSACTFFWQFQPALAPTKACGNFIESREKVVESAPSWKGTAGQVEEGLNALYSDYRNRLVQVQHALIIVNHQISGEPDEEIQKMIEFWRKTDAQ